MSRAHRSKHGGYVSPDDRFDGLDDVGGGGLGDGNGNDDFDGGVDAATSQAIYAAYRRRRRIRRTIAAVLALVLAVPAGYALGGISAFDTVSGELCLSDAQYAIEGTPETVSSSAEVTLKGAKFGMADAGAYYQQAVDRSWRQIDDALLASMSGDLPSMRSAAGAAKTAIDGTIAALRSRTWPAETTNAVEDIVRNYMSLRNVMAHVASSVSEDAGQELETADPYSVSEADAYLRGKLGLDAAKRHTLPMDILSVEDAGVYHVDDDSGLPTVNDGKRVVNVTVRSRVPGDLSDLMLNFDLKSPDGKTVAEAWGDSDRVALANGQSATIAVPIEASTAASGLGLRLTGFSMKSGHQTSRIVKVSDDYAGSVAALADFRLQ